MDFSRTKVLTFDCYGTLIDWESGILAALAPWVDAHGVGAEPEDLLSAFAKAEASAESSTPSAPYPEILRATMHGMATHFSAPCTAGDADRLATSVGDWPAFPDTVNALRRLKQRFKLMVVSNIDRASFARTAKRLVVPFDALVTAEDVGAYKPDHRMFERAFAVLKELGIDREGILHVAQSLYHDHVPAKQLGLRTVWVDRRQGKGGGATHPPGTEVTPDLIVGTLGEFANVVERS